jgi:hypothetical protein
MNHEGLLENEIDSFMTCQNELLPPEIFYRLQVTSVHGKIIFLLTDVTISNVSSLS